MMLTDFDGCQPPVVTCYSGRMPDGYLPIFIFLVLAMAFPVVLLVLAKLIRP